MGIQAFFIGSTSEIRVNKTEKMFRLWALNQERKDNDSKITTIIRFDTMDGLKAFNADEELHKERAAAGVVLEKSVTTLMGEDLLEQYKG